ncbi:hypothetical protein FRC17_010191 [Serendipita sp. 399]|nr:hypothetical protein FRC17_010191 [Serendipita sp. 399]
MAAPIVNVASPLGSPVPAILPHAVSVSLPTWQDNVDYEEGAQRVLDVMKTGYPRFFIHKNIQKLAAICEQKFGTAGEKAMVFPSDAFAKACRDFLTRMDPSASRPARIVQFYICPGDAAPVATYSVPSCDLHIVLYHEQTQRAYAKAFWQHTGTGISSRQAEYCLRLLEKKPDPTSTSRTTQSFELTNGTTPKSPIRCKNRHYYSRSISAADMAEDLAEKLSAEETSYLEERYGRNLPAVAAKEAKETLRKRIAGVLVGERSNCCWKRSEATSASAQSIRGVPNITEDDVFLFPGGMCAIWHAHQLLLKTLGNRKSVCWGFPYVDTLKILEKWGPGCYFFGNGNEFDELEALLEDLQSKSSPNSKEPPILALFCECTSNPLLQTPDLRRLRALADKYGFAIVVDETIGNYANVEVLPYGDIVCSSLTKVFSGETNVMGGGLILNPQGRHYSKLRPTLVSFYEDVYWDEDAIFLERNSRDFTTRVYAINQNAEAVCDLLYSHSLEALEHKAATTNGFHDKTHYATAENTKTNGTTPYPNGHAASPSATDTSPPSSPASSPSFPAISRPIVIKKLYYPKWITTSLYDSLKTPQGGYGGLFSVTFTTPVAARAFFDALGCEKGPSLGTNFTLACPFVILAHYTELDWVKQFGIDPNLVRVSVGLEKRGTLLKWIRVALEAAENAVLASENCGGGGWPGSEAKEHA